MKLFDTQLLSYAHKGAAHFPVETQHISSVVAKEFLLLQEGESNMVNYYLPPPEHLRMKSPMMRLVPNKKRWYYWMKRADRIILDFKGEYPTVVEYSHWAISEIINQQARAEFRSAISQLEAKIQRTLKSRFDFLVRNRITCIPLSRRAVDLGLELFADFTIRYSTKLNFRNTLNDLFILASAVELSAELKTNDSLLNRFAAEYLHGRYRVEGEIATVDFSTAPRQSTDKKKESKGYINRGWSFKARHSNRAW